MIKKTWPNIFQNRINGVTYWVVDSRRFYNGKRHGKREYFHTREQAQGRADVIRTDVMAHGFQNGAIALYTRLDAIRAEEILKPFGKTLIDAATFFADHHKEIESRHKRKLTDSIDLFLSHKLKMTETGNYSMASYKTAKKRIIHLKNQFADKSICNLSVGEFETWLQASHFSPWSMKGIKSVCSEFFKWCIKQGWMQTNPAQFMRIAQDLQEVKILAPDMVEKLLSAANASPFRDRAYTYVLLGLFAGLRPSEADDLEFKDIDFKTSEIRVASRKLRGQVRYVPIGKELNEKLKDMKWTGQLKSSNWRKQFDSIKLMAGFNKDNPFPSDGLRHSFASYWLAIHNDRPRLAEIMGNSVDIIRNHYRKAIPKGQAEEFWKLIA